MAKFNMVPQAFDWKKVEKVHVLVANILFKNPLKTVGEKLIHKFCIVMCDERTDGQGQILILPPTFVSGA